MISLDFRFQILSEKLKTLEKIMSRKDEKLQDMNNLLLENEVSVIHYY